MADMFASASLLVLAYWWIGSAAVAGALAARKRENGFAAFFVGMICGPLVMLYFMAVPAYGTRCPACGETHARMAMVCPFCARKTGQAGKRVL